MTMDQFSFGIGLQIVGGRHIFNPSSPENIDPTKGASTPEPNVPYPAHSCSQGLGSSSKKVQPYEPVEDAMEPE